VGHRVTIPAREALPLQLGALAGNEGASSFLEVRPLSRDGSPMPSERAFVPVRELRRAAAIALELREAANVFVGACPRIRESGTAQDVARCWALWADLDGPDALKRLARFRPLPSLVIRTGSPDHAHAYWSLRRAIPGSWAQRCNRRLARALGGDMASTDPARVLRAVGTLNHKSAPAAEVVCTRLELDVFTGEQVVGALPDSPHYAPRPRIRSIPAGNGSTGPLEALVRTVRDAQVGERNAVLYWAGCRAVDEGLDARELLRQAALDAGLPEREVDATLNSAERRVAA
jgi:RepB DNA-primase from phage plasmid